MQEIFLQEKAYYNIPEKTIPSNPLFIATFDKKGCSPQNLLHPLSNPVFKF